VEVGHEHQVEEPDQEDMHQGEEVRLVSSSVVALGLVEVGRRVVEA